MLAVAVAAGQGGNGADEGGSHHAAVAGDAWPSQRGGHSLRLQLVFPLG